MQKITLRRLGSAALLLALILTTTSAQTPSPAAQQPKTPEPATQRPTGDSFGQATNIKLDLTINDQTGPGEPMKKVVTMVVADRGSASIRSTGSVRAQGRVQINVDAQPMILQNGVIRLRLSLEYNPRTVGSEGPTESSSLNEQIAVILEVGKPLIVSQAADPASDRKITVEVRATLLK